MWDSLRGFVDFLASIFLFVTLLTGAFLWLRYGADGIHFISTVDFNDAMLDWKIRRKGERNT